VIDPSQITVAHQDPGSAAARAWPTPPASSGIAQAPSRTRNVAPCVAAAPSATCSSTRPILSSQSAVSRGAERPYTTVFSAARCSSSTVHLAGATFSGDRRHRSALAIAQIRHQREVP
jgi:hypothetical protein